MSENQAVLDREKVSIDTLESYRKVMFGDMISKNVPINQQVDLWVTNRKTDHWWLCAKSKVKHRTWCAQIVGSDDDTSPNIAKLLIQKLISGEIIGEVNPDSIEVLKANEEMQKSGESVDLSGIVLQEVLEKMPTDKIPEEFRLLWNDDD